MIYNLVGADGQILFYLLEEAVDLLLVNVVQAVREIALHQQDALSDVGNILLRDVRVALLSCHQLNHQVGAHLRDSLL